MSKKILIVDDEEGIRESLKLILSDHYDLILTENGEQCLEVLENAKDVGLALIDIKMPNINGMDLLKQIREKYPNLKVIVVTGYRSVEIAQEATRLGAVGYIVKPFQSKDILETVKRNLK